MNRRRRQTAEGEPTPVATLGSGDMRQNTNAVLVLDNKDLDLHAGQRYGFVVEKTITVEEGKTSVVQSNMATALAIA